MGYDEPKTAKIRAQNQTRVQNRWRKSIVDFADKESRCFRRGRREKGGIQSPTKGTCEILPRSNYSNGKKKDQ